MPRPQSMLPTVTTEEGLPVAVRAAPSLSRATCYFFFAAFLAAFFGAAVFLAAFAGAAFFVAGLAAAIFFSVAVVTPKMRS